MSISILILNLNLIKVIEPTQKNNCSLSLSLSVFLFYSLPQVLSRDIVNIAKILKVAKVGSIFYLASNLYKLRLNPLKTYAAFSRKSLQKRTKYRDKERGKECEREDILLCHRNGNSNFLTHVVPGIIPLGYARRLFAPQLTHAGMWGFPASTKPELCSSPSPLWLS